MTGYAARPGQQYFLFVIRLGIYQYEEDFGVIDASFTIYVRGSLRSSWLMHDMSYGSTGTP